MIVEFNYSRHIEGTIILLLEHGHTPSNHPHQDSSMAVIAERAVHPSLGRLLPNSPALTHLRI